MKTSTAKKNNYICTECEGDIAQDKKGRGFARHKNYGNKSFCDFEKGDSDKVAIQN